MLSENVPCAIYNEVTIALKYCLVTTEKNEAPRLGTEIQPGNSAIGGDGDVTRDVGGFHQSCAGTCSGNEATTGCDHGEAGVADSPVALSTRTVDKVSQPVPLSR